LENSDPTVDVHLTKEGIKQANQLAETLRNVKLDAIIVSELPRTFQTAEIVNQYHGLQIEKDASLNDIRSGFEGKPVADYHKLRGTAKDPFTTRFNSGESPRDVYKRTQKFLKKLERRSEKTVLIVTSKHNLRHFKSVANGTDPSSSLGIPVANTEVFEFDI
jgi:broad specificity phosphatase PhoE